MSAALCCCPLMAFAVALHRAATASPLPRRPAFADVAAGLIAVWLFALCFCLSGRPAFALTLGMLLLAALWAVNAAKTRALRGEPLVITDVALAWQTVRFPSLYLPFLPCKTLALGSAVGLAALMFLWRLSPPQPIAGGWWAVIAAPLAACLLLHTRSGYALTGCLQATFPLKFDPRADARRYGPLGAALLHLVWHLTLRGRNGMGVCNSATVPVVPPPWYGTAVRWAHNAPKNRLPHIFLVQAESFCDPRIFSSAVPYDVLRNWDSLCAEAQSGRLLISAFGAYTMRTEYAVLTGQPADTLGTDAFHPYLGAARYPAWSIARHLRSCGYRTVCLHPFYREFFCRHKAIPNLGFEQFVTLENFPHKDAWGPYVSDNSVARSMLDLLGEEKRPVFCFAITMENHGPWLPGRLREEFVGSGAPSVPGLGKTENGMADAPAIPGLDAPVCRYLAHLRHADAMLGMLRNGLRQSGRPAVLGWYGDHMPNLKGLIPQGETATPYVVWRTGTSGNTASKADITPEELGGYLLTPATTLR